MKMVRGEKRNKISLFFLILVLQSLFFVEGKKTIAANKIKHVIVLMEENRSFDHMFGWYPGVNGLTGKEYNQVNTSIPNSEKIYVDKIEPMIAPCDPDHGTYATTYKIFGPIAFTKNDTTNATMCGFVEYEGIRGNAKTNYCDVMSMLTPEHVPIITNLADEFVLFDRFFAAYPGPTWPNRLYMLTGTSAGLTETGPWYHNQDGTLFPQKTFFDQIDAEGLTWRNYYNDTPWELFLGGIAHNPENLASMEQFFVDAAEGNLPSFAWINPRSGVNLTLMQGSNDQHPDHDIALGEQYYKDIYEALRSSPQWNETLFVITYDEHGGYYDHVPTPLNVPPPGDGEKSYPDEGILFDRLGIRLPTLLISPWIPKGLVVSDPPMAQKPAKNSEFTLTSIIATTRILLGMESGPLTQRDAWSATFEYLFNLTEPRTDCPLHLPPALPPANITAHIENESNMPINGLQHHIMTVHAHLGGTSFPHHINTQGQVSEWLQHQYRAHETRTLAWKRSKATPQIALVIRPSNDKAWVGTGWNVNKGVHTGRYTISLRTFNNTYCMDNNGDTAGISLCYPSSNPDTNRDPTQQWIWENDATVRPFNNSNLCLTNYLLDGYETVFLRTCEGSVEQHWAYHGPGAGNEDDGSIVFGDSANSVGVVNVTSTKAYITSHNQVAL